MHEQTPEDYREALTDISRAAQRMRAIIEALLDLARFDADSEPQQRDPCDLAFLTQDCITLLQPLADAKRIQLVLDLQPAACFGNLTSLAQVIANLLNNAIHFTPDEGAITLQTLNNDGARFIITDTGPGIAPEQLPHLFERFHRADTSRNRSTGGTGLGLAICHAIIKSHGGTISVDTQVGKGSTFTVQLPHS